MLIRSYTCKSKTLRMPFICAVGTASPSVAAMQPRKGTLKLMEKLTARFFWTGGDSTGRYHSATWKKLCFPYKGGGANFNACCKYGELDHIVDD